MTKPAKITIYQKKNDADLKRLIADLRSGQGDENQYQGRSESEIAKMVLRKALENEHRRVCGSKSK